MRGDRGGLRHVAGGQPGRPCAREWERSRGRCVRGLIMSTKALELEGPGPPLTHRIYSTTPEHAGALRCPCRSPPEYLPLHRMLHEPHAPCVPCHPICASGRSTTSILNHPVST